MIQMGMRQQHVVDAGGVKAKGLSILFVKLAATLIQPAVNQDPLPGALNQMTGTGDIPIRSMKRYFQVPLPYARQDRLKSRRAMAPATAPRAEASRSHRASV